MNSTGRLLILAIVFSLSACASGVMGNLGYWVNEKPYRGTLDKNKFHVHPYWQCVENAWSTHNIKECD